MREVVLGRNSKVWRALSRLPGVSDTFEHVIGHLQLDRFEFTRQDRVWVLSHSRDPRENSRMLQRLLDSPVEQVVYISSASTIVLNVTRCYSYPLTKGLAEDRVLRDARGRVLTIGLVYEDAAELPSGRCVATHVEELARFMKSPKWGDRNDATTQLFRLVDRPFRSSLEHVAYRVYGSLISRLDRYACLLRPFDAALRLLGYRWYGYTFLSNRLWISRIS